MDVEFEMNGLPAKNDGHTTNNKKKSHMHTQVYVQQILSFITWMYDNIVIIKTMLTCFTKCNNEESISLHFSRK